MSMVENYHNPLLVKRYEQELFRFLSDNVNSFEEEYEEYCEEMENSSGSKRIPPTPSLFDQIYAAKKELRRCQETGSLRYTKSINDTIVMGKAISELNNVSIVDPDLNQQSRGIGSVFAERIYNEKDYWDTVFELEVATKLKGGGFDPLLVDEGQQGGPDIIVRSEGEDVWIECKRKRPYSSEEREQNEVIEDIIGRVYSGFDFGVGGLSVSVKGDGFLGRDDADCITDSIVSLAKEKKLTSKTVSSGGSNYTVELVDYHEGTEIVTDVTKKANSLEDASAKELPFNHLNTNLNYDHDLSRRRAECKVENDDLHIKKALALDIQISDSIDYVDWIMESVERGRDKVSDHEPSIVCIDVPRGKIAEMGGKTCIDHKGNKVALTKRLDQRIIGQLADSDSLNAVSITSRAPQEPEIGVTIPRLVRTIPNNSPGTELPDELMSFITFD